MKSGFIKISDPCYEPGIWCTANVKAKNGVWNAYTTTGVFSGWGKRVIELFAVHEEFEGKNRDIMYPIPADIGVDSGQCGLFDNDQYRGVEGHDGWYETCCNVSAGDGGAIHGGVISSSGFGDGGYQAFVTKDGDDAVAVKVVFIVEGDEEEDDTWDDEEEEE